MYIGSKKTQIVPKGSHILQQNMFVRLLQFDNAVSSKGSFPSAGWLQIFC